mmetsp:Transcript_28388/g.76905  ORF Transcript_28388/g.76905 Transcript_28388/m.76905 type:complete len:474 (+) Transcript_28388:163-1584(+)
MAANERQTTRTKDEEFQGVVPCPESCKAGGTTNRSADTVLLITYVNIVLYALCYQLQRPVEPYLIESLVEKEMMEDPLSSSTSSVNQTYGSLQSFFSFCQTFGSPLVGILLDRIGIRMTSCVVFFASALSYAILASASDLTLLFVSKIPTVFQAAFLVAQATAATITGDDASMRAAALGRMTTAYTIGATIGPALGGYLAGQGDFYVGAKLAVGGSLLSAILSLWFLPDSVKTPEEAKVSKNGQTNKKRNQRSFLEDARHSGRIACRSNIWPLLAVKVIGGVCASMHSTTLPLVLTQTLRFEPQQLGLVMSCGMFAVAFFGAFSMAPLTKRLGPFGMMNAGLLSRSVLGLILAGIVTMYASLLSKDRSTSGVNVDFVLVQVITVSIVHALSQHVLATGLTTQTTGSVDKDEQGALLGLEHSLFSFARIGGPAIGTVLLGFGGVVPVEMTCGSIDILTVAFLSMSLPPSKRKGS